MVGHHSIVDKASAYGAKGPGFTTRWKQQFIFLNVCSVEFCSLIKNKAPLGAKLKKNIFFDSNKNFNCCVKSEKIWEDQTYLEAFFKIYRRLSRIKQLGGLAPDS